MQLFTWPITILVIRLLEPGDYGLLAMAMVTIGFVALFSEMGLGSRTGSSGHARRSHGPRRQCGDLDLQRRDGRRDRTAGAVGRAVVRRTRFDRRDARADAGAADLVGRLPCRKRNWSDSCAFERCRSQRLFRRRRSGGHTGPGLAGYGVWALVMGTLAGALRAHGADRGVTTVASCGRRCGTRWPRSRGWFGFSGHVLAARTLWYWYGQSDQVILARLLHASTLGYYSVAAQLAMLPANKAMEVINRVTFPVLSRMRSEQGDCARCTALDRPGCGVRVRYVLGHGGGGS